MKFKERLQKVLQTLGLIDKAKKNELNFDDWKKIEASYKETHGSDLYDDMKDDKEQAEKAKAHDEAVKLFAENAGEESDEHANKGEEQQEEKPKVDLSAEIQKMKDENTSLKNDLKKFI